MSGGGSGSSPGSVARGLFGANAITPAGRLRNPTAARRRRVNRALREAGREDRFGPGGFLR